MLPVLGCAQGFGRFGYSDTPQVSGFAFTSEGFRARSGAADTFRFMRPIDFKRTATTPERADYACGVYAGNPQSMTVNLRAPGFEVDCYYGLELKLSSLGGPVLTVGSASYGPGTPAPLGDWVLVTFAEAQPPVLLGFLDGRAETIVAGKSGEWRLKTVTPYRGRIRICLPKGVKNVSANGVAALGELAQAVSAQGQLWSSPAPRLLQHSVEKREGTVKVSWIFDRPGALVPPAYSLAKMAGYKLKSSSDLVDLGGFDENGPLTVCRSSIFTAEFPLNSLPSGRPVVLTDSAYKAPPTTTQPSVPVFFNGAIANYMGGRTQAWRSWGTSALDEYLARAVYTAEPLSRLLLPCDASGNGADLAATAACLSRCVNPHMKDNNRLLELILKRMDTMTWKLEGDDRNTLRRAAAISSFGCLLQPDSNRVGTAVMLHAGLLAEKALQKFLVDTGQAAEARTVTEPLKNLRLALFTTGSKVSPPYDALFSPVRVVSDQPVTLRANGNKVRLLWSKTTSSGRRVSFGSGLPFALAQESNAVASDVTSYSPSRGDTGWIVGVWPKTAPPLPRAASLPQFED